SEDDLSGDQLLPDVLEAHGRLVERDPETRGDRVERVRGRDAARDAAPPPLARQQVPEEERQDLVGLNVAPAAVADAEAVRVPVARQAQPRARAAHVFGEPHELLLAALRRLAAEEGIGLRVQPRELRARLFEPGVEEA